VVGIHQFPDPAGIFGGLAGKIGGAEAVVCPEILNHLTQDAYFVEKLQAVGKQDVA